MRYFDGVCPLFTLHACSINDCAREMEVNPAMISITPVNDGALHTQFYTADEVALLLRLAKPTIYEHARQDPTRFGVLRFGRAVRFRRNAIDRLVAGE